MRQEHARGGLVWSDAPHNVEVRVQVNIPRERVAGLYLLSKTAEKGERDKPTVIKAAIMPG